MAPMISNSKIKEEQGEIIYKDEKKHLLQLRKFIEKHFDYVGKDFSKKVREVYYDKKSKKNIYGSATEEEKEELKEEGINLVNIPWVDKDN